MTKGVLSLLFLFLLLSCNGKTNKLFKSLLKGSLDPSYASSIYFSTANFNIIDSMIASDNTIWVASRYALNGTKDFTVNKFKGTGGVDSSFGTGGMARALLATQSSDYPNTMDIFSDQSILVGGTKGDYNNTNVILIKWTPSGQLDPSFGSNGKLLIDFGGFDVMVKAKILENQKILILAEAYITSLNRSCKLARYHSNGTPDTTFGANGVTTLTFAGIDGCNKLEVLTNGKILVGTPLKWNHPELGSRKGYSVFRYNSDGSVDSSFGINGVATGLFNTEYYSYEFITSPSQKILIMGSSNDANEPRDFFLMQFNENGSLDNTFGVNGVVTIDFSGRNDTLRKIYFQPDGKLLLAGESANSENNANETHTVVARLLPNGSLDSLFGQEGKTFIYYPNQGNLFLNISVSNDGCILIAISPANSPGVVMSLLSPSGNPNTTFGQVNLDIPGIEREYVTTFHQQSDGQVYVVGLSSKQYNLTTIGPESMFTAKIQ